MERFGAVFGRRSGVIFAMVHVRALPGTPQNNRKLPEIIDIALQETEVYKKAGVDAIMIENMHDIPYLPPEKVGPEITAAMTAVACSVKRSCPHLPCGIQILSGANRSALAVAQAAGLNFIRAEGFVFSHIADEGLMNACAGELLRYRRFIHGEDILIFTDVKKKHSSHAITSDLSIAETARAAEFFNSDGVIITGTETGTPVNKSELKAVQQEVTIPILVGSGVTLQNVSDYISASALIVGSHFKRNGQWMNEIVPQRVQSFMTKVKKLR